ncbi:MAG: GldG family protein [Oscillospiraceae bacterium]|nr:GldG family protein [Oscillospiraceae bacterium]
MKRKDGAEERKITSKNERNVKKVKASKTEIKRKFKYGGFATLITVIFIVAVVAVNFIATGLTDKYGLRVDLTADNRFEISKESKEYVKGIDKDVDIYILYEEQGYKNLNDLYAQAASVIESYGYANSRIKIHYENIIENPSFVKKFPKLELATGDIVVSCGENAKKISPYDMFEAKDDNTIDSYVEREFTRAILYVTSGQATKVTLVTGYNSDDASGFVDILENNNYEVVETALATEEIDPESKAVILFGPKTDIPEEAVKKIDKFLENEGKLGKTLIYFMSSDPLLEHMENLDALLKDWGIEVGYGYVYETNGNNIIGSSPLAVSAGIVDKDAAGSVADKGLIFAIANARPINFAFEKDGNYETKTLVEFSSTAAVMPEDASEDYTATAEDICGPMPAVAYATCSRYSGTTLIQSKIAVVASTVAAQENTLKISSFANAEYMRNFTNYLTDTEEGVYIAAKNISTDTLIATESQKSAVRIIFVFVIPAIVLLCGAGIWLFRRHK